MSIIYEALKKTQVDSRQANPEAACQDQDISVSAIKKTANKKFWFFASLAAAVSGILALTLVVPYPKKLDLHLSPKKTLHLPPAVKASDEKAVSGKALPGLILNGIVLSPDGNIALVNDQIVRPGDIIEGSKVEEIGENQVVLTLDNERFTLTAK